MSWLFNARPTHTHAKQNNRVWIAEGFQTEDRSLVEPKLQNLLWFDLKSVVLYQHYIQETQENMHCYRCCYLQRLWMESVGWRLFSCCDEQFEEGLSDDRRIPVQQHSCAEVEVVPDPR